MGLLMKALELTWAKPMHMLYTCIFLCGGGMNLLKASFANSGYLHGKSGLRELSFEFTVCDIS